MEDAGICFAAWNQLPGTFIKFFLKEVGTQGLLDMLQAFPNRKAEARCCVAFFDGQETHFFIGTVEGEITPEIRGASPFGRDPIFLPLGQEKTFGEMSEEEKNQISHRKRAREQLKEFLVS